MKEKGQSRAIEALPMQIAWNCIVMPLCTVFWLSILWGNKSIDKQEALSGALRLSGSNYSKAAYPSAHLDTSYANIEYVLRMWDLFMQKHFPKYQPSQHGVLQEKYAGLKGQLFYQEMLVARERNLKVKTICEVGMYAGAFAIFWLLANEDARLYTFDTFSLGKGMSQLAANSLVKMGRTVVVKGSSTETVPKFTKEHPNEKCDLVFIDGSKNYDIRLNHLARYPGSHVDSLHFCPQSVEDLAGQNSSRKSSYPRMTNGGHDHI